MTGKQNKSSQDNTFKPPFSLEAEQALLGGILVDPDSLIKHEIKLYHDDFYEPRHAHLVELINKMNQAGCNIDLVTLSDFAEKEGLLHEIGGQSYLMDLTGACPTSANIIYYYKIVREKAQLRRIMKMGMAMTKVACEPDAVADDVLNQAERVLLDAGQNKLQAIKPVGDYLEDVISGLSSFIDHPENKKGISFTLPTIDKTVGGMQPGELIFLAARPGLGKSALSAQIALNAANDGKNVLFLSLEMNPRELLNRMLSSITRIKHEDIRKGNVSHEMMPQIMSASNNMYKIPLALDFSKYVDIIDIRTKVRSSCLKKHVDLVVVDYLQLIDYRAEKELDALSKITRLLKLLAQEVGCTILCLSQLNRKIEDRDLPIPNMSDLKGSGTIEADADMVLFLAPPVKKTSMTGKYGDWVKKELDKEAFKVGGKVALIMEKVRNAPSCDVDLRFERDYQSFTEWS